MNACITRSLPLGLLALTLSSAGFTAQPDELFRTHVYSDTLLVEPGADQSFDFDVDLIVSGPDGFYHRESFSAGSVIEFDPSAVGQGQLVDGTYNYELRVMDTGQRLVRGLDQPETASAALSSPHSGAFSIKDGSFVSPDAVEAPLEDVNAAQKSPANASLETNDSDEGGDRSQTFATDLIVQGSTCIGFDCTSSESFGFDTLRFKENNLRIKFEDTSSSGSFPSNDWEIVANDSANGGDNYLAIRDVDGNRVPFKVRAGAANNAMVVSNNSRVGFRTANPALDLHVATGNTPGLRLEQDGSAGFTPQSWDIAGNEANFFVRDTTNGSSLPFKIRPGADSDSLVVDSDSDVGIGTGSPNAPLHIKRDDNSARVIIEDTGTGNQPMLTLANQGSPILQFDDRSQAGVFWTFAIVGTEGSSERFQINKPGSNSIEMKVFAGGDVEFGGDVTANGVLLTSARATKTDFAPIDTNEILDKLASLEITEWRYRKDEEGTRHIGAVAEEFQETFGLSDGKTLNMIDTTGVSFAAIKALKDQVDEKEVEVQELNDKVERLERAVETLMSRVEEQ